MKGDRVRLVREIRTLIGSLLQEGTVVGNDNPWLPTGYELTDTGISGDQPLCALLEHPDGRFSWVRCEDFEGVTP